MTTLKNLGWAHSAAHRTGHYLDEGDPVCGFNPRTFLGDLDLRTIPPTEACPDCVALVERSGGSVRHRHRWLDASTFGGRSFVCRCGENRGGA